METITFKQGSTPRGELELPTLHFVVIDQWQQVIDKDSIWAWLEMFTFTDRTPEEGKDKWEQSKIPTSFIKLTKKLGISTKTWYNKILPDLWDVGLIDIEEYSDSEQKGTKPMNVIVYKYPQNKKELAHKPLERVRNYKTDYSSDAQIFGKKGGRPKGVSVGNRGVFPLETGGCFPGKHNNIFNPLINIFNPLINNLNSSSSSEEQKIDEEEEIIGYENTKAYLKNELEYPLDFIQDIVEQLHIAEIPDLTDDEMLNQHCWMLKKDSEESIGHWTKYFVLGIIRTRKNPKRVMGMPSSQMKIIRQEMVPDWLKKEQDKTPVSEEAEKHETKKQELLDQLHEMNKSKEEGRV